MSDDRAKYIRAIRDAVMRGRSVWAAPCSAYVIHNSVAVEVGRMLQAFPGGVALRHAIDFAAPDDVNRYLIVCDGVALSFTHRFESFLWCDLFPNVVFAPNVTLRVSALNARTDTR